MKKILLLGLCSTLFVLPLVGVSATPSVIPMDTLSATSFAESLAEPSVEPVSAMMGDSSAELLPAFAEGRAITANGVVKAVHTYDVTAPYSGTLLPFDWEKGDEVRACETLFTFDTFKIYAPADGKITLFASMGDNADDVLAQYGMLASVQKNACFQINATTSRAYNSRETKFVHNGETLYFRSLKDSAQAGSGRVVYADQKGYTVEIVDDGYELGDKVRLFREENKDAFSSVGEGTISRANDVKVLGTGRVANCAVQDGQMVSKGDLLFETVSVDCPVGEIRVEVVAPQAGVLGGLMAASGQQVYKGQVLATVHCISALKVVAEVDEVDLWRVQPGAAVSIVFDSYPEERVLGTVSRISGMGTQKQNATYYDVDVVFACGLDVRLLMSATVTLP